MGNPWLKATFVLTLLFWLPNGTWVWLFNHNLPHVRPARAPPHVLTARKTSEGWGHDWGSFHLGEAQWSFNISFEYIVPDEFVNFQFMYGHVWWGGLYCSRFSRCYVWTCLVGGGSTADELPSAWWFGLVGGVLGWLPIYLQPELPIPVTTNLFPDAPEFQSAKGSLGSHGKHRDPFSWLTSFWLLREKKRRKKTYKR